MKRNLFIHLKPLPEIAFGENPDRYRAQSWKLQTGVKLLYYRVTKLKPDRDIVILPMSSRSAECDVTFSLTFQIWGNLPVPLACCL